MLQNIALLFPFIGSILWIITFLLRWKHTSFPMKTGAMALVFMAIASFIRFFSLQEIYRQEGFYLFDILEVYCTLGFFSCLILSFRLLTQQKPLNRKSFLVFLPGIVFAGILLLIYAWIGETRITPFIRDVVHSYEKNNCYPGTLFKLYDLIYFYLYKVVIILFANIVLVYAWIQLNRYRETLKSFIFPSAEETIIQHYQAIFRFLFATILFSAFTLIWDYLVYREHYTIIGFCMFLWGCALFYLGYHISRVEYITEEYKPNKQPIKEKISNTENKEAEDINMDHHTDEEAWLHIKEKLLVTLDQLMEKEMVFTQRDLKLENLALKANTNRTYLSRLIKEEHQYGFSEYISRKRIEYACLLIRETPSLTLEQLADKSGFSYGTAFSRAFKQYTGITFREWKKNKHL